jgi:hypothetical protein
MKLDIGNSLKCPKCKYVIDDVNQDNCKICNWQFKPIKVYKYKQK